MMMGLGKLQLHAKFEVASFIYYGNIWKFVLNDWDKPNWRPLISEETEFTIGYTA